MAEEKNTVSIYPDNELMERIKTFSANENRSLNNAVLHILKLFFGKEGK